MNEDIERQRKVEELAQALINNEHISRWAIMPFRAQLRDKLEDNDEALERLEELTEAALESL